MSGAEFALTREMVLRVSGGTELAERFPLFRDRLKGRLPTSNQVGREQVELLARYRAETDEDRREAVKSALLLSINCIAVAFGSTGVGAPLCRPPTRDPSCSRRAIHPHPAGFRTVTREGKNP